MHISVKMIRTIQETISTKDARRLKIQRRQTKNPKTEKKEENNTDIMRSLDYNLSKKDLCHFEYQGLLIPSEENRR